MNIDDAVTILVRFMRSRPAGSMHAYGYEIYVPEMIRDLVREQSKAQGMDLDAEVNRQKGTLAPSFAAAAWELCRRGILRPGVFGLGSQSTDQGSAGFGYTVTPFGRQWLAESDKD